MAQRATNGAAQVGRGYVPYEEWLARPEDARQSEWVDGEVIEFMPPKTIHQAILLLLATLVNLYVQGHRLGRVLVAPFEMRLAHSAREPDLAFVASANLDRLDENRLTGGADLAVEIVSDDSVTRDRVEKRAEYEAAAVRDYWILDPRPGRSAFEMLALGDDGRYAAIEPDAAGRYRSRVPPGLWLNPALFWQEPLPKRDALIAAIRDEDRDAG